MLCCFFFFKQKTAYEMRISDWSSDVCSSDLAGPRQSFDERPMCRRGPRHRSRPRHGKAGKNAIWHGHCNMPCAFPRAPHGRPGRGRGDRRNGQMASEKLFGLQAAALQLRSQRLMLLASNIANAATPHYKRSEEKNSELQP